MELTTQTQWDIFTLVSWGLMCQYVSNGSPPPSTLNQLEQHLSPRKSEPDDLPDMPEVPAQSFLGKIINTNNPFKRIIKGLETIDNMKQSGVLDQLWDDNFLKEHDQTKEIMNWEESEARAEAILKGMHQVHHPDMEVVPEPITDSSSEVA